MSLLTKAQFLAKYADSSTGEFASNTSQAIKSVNLRNFATDFADSAVFVSSDVYNQQTSIVQAAMLTGNTTPITVIAAQGTGIIINPVAFLVNIQYGSAVFAGNTTFRFEINGVAVSSINSSIMPNSSSRTVIVPVLTSLDTTTDLTNKACVLKVQGGNPTGGTGSIIFVSAVYSTLNVA